MRRTWRLRPGVLWHDDTEFTSADVKFGYEVTVDPAGPLGVASPATRAIDAIDTPDPYTVVVHWRATSRWGGELGRMQLNLLPRHLLEAESCIVNCWNFPTNNISIIFKTNRISHSLNFFYNIFSKMY